MRGRRVAAAKAGSSSSSSCSRISRKSRSARTARISRTASPPLGKAAPPPAYTLRDEGGRVAVYAGTQAAPSAPLQICDIYTRLLPENDLLHLQEGIPVYSDAQLEALLEDLGL